MSKNVGILNKLRQLLPEKHLLMLYNSLILPYIHYLLFIIIVLFLVILCLFPFSLYISCFI